MLPISAPLTQYNDNAGQPLNMGYLYFGQVNDNPETAPITVYWDIAGTQPAAQPIRTIGGYASRNGTPANVYSGQSFSLTVKNSKGVQIFYGKDSSQFDSGAALNNSFLGENGASSIGWIQSGFGAIYRSVMDKLRENVSAIDFGALNDGLTSSATRNRLAIQKAIDYLNSVGGGTLKIGGIGVYYVDLTAYFKDDGTEYGVTSIKMKDNVSVQIEPGATIRIIPNAYGASAYYRMFSSGDVARLKNSAIFGGGTIDGNRQNQIPNDDDNASNIQLEVDSSVRIQGIRSINSKGMGIQIRGVPSSNASGIIICDNFIDNIRNIGIQVGFFQNLVISNNCIVNCQNNAIDINGENGTTTCQSYGFSITGNVINTALTGVFCETVRNGVVSGNHITQCTYGYIVNRINGQPKGISFNGGSTLTCQYGARVTGDTGGISFDGVTFSDFSSSGIQIGEGATGSVSYVSVTNCTFIPSFNTVPIIAVGGFTSSFNSWDGNTVVSAGISENLLVVDISVTSTGNSSGNFTVLPSQVGKRGVGEVSGIFTPTLSGSSIAGSQTYVTRSGKYSKIGKVVNFSLSISLSAKDVSTSGSLVIDGLPFVADSGPSFAANIGQAQFLTLTAGYTQFSAGISPGSSRISITQLGSNQPSAAISSAAFSATTAITITGSYLAPN